MSVLEQIIKERDALQSQLDSLRQELRRIVSDVYGENVAAKLEDDEELLGAVENLGEIIEGRDKEIARYRGMFLCSVCGKPMGWKPDDPLGQALKEFVKEGRWGHSTCQTPRKS